MNRDAKERLMIEMLPLIQRAAARFCARVPVSRDDAFQEACVGVWKAIDDFDPALSIAPWTFLSRRAVGAMLDYVRERVHPFGSVRRHKHKRLMSLNAVTYDDGHNPTTLGSCIPDHRPSPMEAVESEEAVQDILKHVWPHERRILRAVCVDGQRQRDVAVAMGVSESSVSQLYRQAVHSLKEVPHAHL